MRINHKAREFIDMLMVKNPNTILTIGYLHKGEKTFKLYDTTGEIPYKSHAYEIASISKVFTTSLLAKYLHEEKMNLNDSVAKYIPELEEYKYYPTLKRLATHTAGYKYEMHPTVGLFVKLILISFWRLLVYKKPVDYYNYVLDYKGLISHAKKTKLEDRDYDWEYLDYSIALLAEAICQRSGIPFDDLVMQFLEEELGLKHTKTITDRPDMLDGYLNNRNVGTMKKGYRKGNYTAPAGGLTSTAEDLLEFAKMNIEESPSYLALTHECFPTNQEGFDMGLGWWYWNEQENPPYSHGGGSEGFSSSLTFIKELGNAVVVLTNTHGYDDIYQLSNEIFRGNLEDE